MRHVILGLLVLALVLCAVAAANDPPADPPEPPVRLRKKPNPPDGAAPAKKPQPPRKNDSEDGPDVEGKQLEQALQETLNRVAEDFGRAEARLKKNDTGEFTRQIQGDRKSTRLNSSHLG